MPTHRPRGRPPHPDVLTPAEWRTLHWIRHGLRRRAIADVTGTTENAVKYHVANIASKLGVQGMSELRAWPGFPADSTIHARRSTSMTPPPVSLGPLGQVSLLSRELGRTETFYRDVLGLAHLFTFGNLAFFDCAGVRLYVHVVPDEEWRPGSILYFTVVDMIAAVSSLTAAGVGFAAPPHLVHRDDAGGEEWMAFFADPDGNQLALMSRIAPGGEPSQTAESASPGEAH